MNACACGFLKGLPLPPSAVRRNGDDRHMVGYCVVNGVAKVYCRCPEHTLIDAHTACEQCGETR